MYQRTKCNIYTFDCTLDCIIPPSIADRTNAYKVCMGSKTETRGKNNEQYMTLSDMNILAKRPEGPDYLKIDVEGYEWSILGDLSRYVADKGKDIHAQLPLQIYAEFHMDRDPINHNIYVGNQLLDFFYTLFINAGYMIMFNRGAIMSRNFDAHLVKVFCPINA